MTLSPLGDPKPTLFYGDNLPILRQHIASASVDLVYLDPPFNSSRSYNVLFKDESGHETEAQIAAFEDTWHWNRSIEREGAAIGVFITLEPASREMQAEAGGGGFYHSPGWDTDYPRLQILSIADLLAGAEVKMPPGAMTFKQAARVKPGAEQLGLF